MTELKDEHQPETAQPAPEWPETAAIGAGDPSVAAIAATLGRVQDLPVAAHGAVYSELHDALLQALNEDAPFGQGGS